MRLTRLLFFLPFALSGCNNTNEQLAVGTLEWDRIEVAAQIAEPVLAWDAREGTQVDAGQVLLRLDTASRQALVAAAEAVRDQATARLAELERGTRPERIAQTEAQLTGAEQLLKTRQREVARQESLLARKLIAPEQVDLARSAADSARAERDAARATLSELRHGATVEERDQARHALAAAEAELQAARIDLEHTTIKAPVAGRLDELPFKPGERPTVGGVVAVILAGDRPYARVYIPEPLRAQVRPGSAARIAVDGIAVPFEGSVRKVAADPSFTPYFALTEHDRGRLSYVAEIDLDSDDRTLPAGVPVQVRFESAAAD